MALACCSYVEHGMVILLIMAACTSHPLLATYAACWMLSQIRARAATARVVTCSCAAHSWCTPHSVLDGAPGPSAALPAPWPEAPGVLSAATCCCLLRLGSHGPHARGTWLQMVALCGTCAGVRLPAGASRSLPEWQHLQPCDAMLGLNLCSWHVASTVLHLP
jgi:hypothetical protein